MLPLPFLSDLKHKIAQMMVVMWQLSDICREEIFPREIMMFSGMFRGCVKDNFISIFNHCSVNFTRWVVSLEDLRSLTAQAARCCTVNLGGNVRTVLTSGQF